MRIGIWTGHSDPRDSAIWRKLSPVCKPLRRLAYENLEKLLRLAEIIVADVSPAIFFR